MAAAADYVSGSGSVLSGLSGLSGIEYSRALFVDNDGTQVRLVKESLPRINTIRIPESESLKPTPMSEIQRSFDIPDTNKYLERAYRIRTKPSHLLDPVSGIQDKHIALIDAWFASSRGPNALLMDWDRTLSMFEGYYGDDEGDIIGDRAAYYEDVLVFLFGGAKRLAAIRDMIARAHARRVDVYIVTNNGGCDEPGSGFNHFVAQLFHPIGVPYKLICGRYFGGHKGKALESDPRFALLKLPLSGGARTKRRRQKSRRRMTHRRK